MPEAATDALRRVRRLATGILALLALGYLGTHLLPDSTGVRLLRAMCEAGMIGGLADWFAVVALFRRPLGLPIPHTALLPRNQARAAQNVGQFFQTNFLRPDLIRARLLPLRPGTFVMRWLSTPDHAATIAAEVVRMLPVALAHAGSPRVLARLRGWLRGQLRRDRLDQPMADALARLAADMLNSNAVDAPIAMLRQTIDQNRDLATRLVQSQSRWWIAKAIDRKLANTVVDGVLALLDDLQKPDSALRHDLQASLLQMIDRMAQDGRLNRAVARARGAVSGGDMARDLFVQLTGFLRAETQRQLDADPGALTLPLAGLIRDFARRAAADPAMLAVLDTRLTDLATQVLDELRPAIGGYVADVIANWKADELVQRFETELGPDLQYIRINGAVLGALIGGVLFGLNAVLT